MLTNDTIKYLPEFIVLAEQRNYLSASEELFLSESSLSKHIRALEAELGHDLLLRSGHRLTLTEFGVLFLEYAKRFAELDREYTHAQLAFESQAASTVKLAVARSMNCDHIVNMLSDHFLEKYPDYHISTGEFSRTVSLEQTFRMGYDLVFSLDDKPTSDIYECYPWATSPLVAILPRSHPLAGEECIQLSQLADDIFLLFPEGTFLHRISLELCRKSGFKPRVDFTIHGTSNLAELVSAGVGVSLTSASDILIAQKHDVAILDIDPSPLVYLNLYRRKDIALPNVAKAFWDYAIWLHINHKDDIPFLGPEAPIANVYFD